MASRNVLLVRTLKYHRICREFVYTDLRNRVNSGECQVSVHINTSGQVDMISINDKLSGNSSQINPQQYQSGLKVSQSPPSFPKQRILGLEVFF